MDRRNTQGFIQRIRVKNQGSTSGNNPRTGARTFGKWAGWTFFAVVALIVISVAFAGNKVNQSFSRMGTGQTNGVPMAAATSAAAAPDPLHSYTYKVAGESANISSSESAPAYGGAAQAPGQTGGGTTQTQSWDRKIIRSATLLLSVTDVSAAVDKVQTLASLHGGYVFQEDSHQEGEYTLASITIQVPSQEFDKIMPDLKKLDGLVKKVGQSGVTSSDVTEEYTDLQSQLRNLQATEARILALQQKATQLSDILSLDQQLRQIQGDTERIQGRLNFLSKRSDMSSIAISLQPDKFPVANTTEPTTGWQPGEIVQRAWNASLDMLSNIATVVLTVAVFFWWTPPFLILLLWLAIRARRRSTYAATPPAPPATTSAGEASAS